MWQFVDFSGFPFSENTKYFKWSPKTIYSQWLHHITPNFTHPKIVVGIENASFTVSILHVILNEKVKSHSFKQLWAVSNIFSLS